MTCLSVVFPRLAHAKVVELKPGDAAPLFQVQDDQGKTFDLAKDRKGKWTVLYFYPKADTPGCTKQACAFRDSVKAFRELGAEIYGVSSDKPEALRKFREKHQLNFPLLADPELKAIEAYGAKMPVVGFAKRWTFIIDPELKIRHVDRDVDPVADAKRMSAKLKELQSAGG